MEHRGQVDQTIVGDRKDVRVDLFTKGLHYWCRGLEADRAQTSVAVERHRGTRLTPDQHATDRLLQTEIGLDRAAIRYLIQTDLDRTGQRDPPVSAGASDQVGHLNQKGPLSCHGGDLARPAAWPRSDC